MGTDHARIIASDVPCPFLQVIRDASAPGARSDADALAAIARDDRNAILFASPDQTQMNQTDMDLTQTAALSDAVGPTDGAATGWEARRAIGYRTARH